MSNIKEIKNQIDSVINTKKITKAMEMIAASKMRKTEERMRSGRPYIHTLETVINHILNGHIEYQHSYLKKTKTTRVGIIVISTDKGLCGSLNTNLFKKILLQMKYFTNKNILCDFILFGSKSLSVFKSCGSSILSVLNNFGDKPQLPQLIGIIKVTLEAYQTHQIDKVFIAYNKFYNKMIYHPTITQLLPLSSKKQKDRKKRTSWDYLYEPDSKFILDLLFDRYVESMIYQSLLENIASEQAARMIAMKKATDNSSNRVQELQLIYNKIRQANITQELTEIISGASAVTVN